VRLRERRLLDSFFYLFSNRERKRQKGADAKGEAELKEPPHLPHTVFQLPAEYLAESKKGTGLIMEGYLKICAVSGPIYPEAYPSATKRKASHAGSGRKTSQSFTLVLMGDHRGRTGRMT